ncbi:hypothetical protein CEY15_16220 [Dietzia natronolimnaea]|uniref:Glycine zipper-like domain-containing protein n=1 Tax=Dietzia natronolimnaea TaxID=161920 RepID=A0A2A2WL48_9ACTN|nr:hypothetical protein [Dietzia natronolimnaea]PAY21920.1 hypothetical protein CEY15_16220 [Dietzia natronolimnaea]
MKNDKLRVGIALGLAIGTAFGLAMENIGAGIAIGMAIGIAFGAALSGGDEDEGEAGKGSSPDSEDKGHQGLGRIAAEKNEDPGDDRDGA